MNRKITLSALEVKNLKEEARKRGVDIASIYSYSSDELRDTSSIKEFLIKSPLEKEEILIILIDFFKSARYQGKVRLVEVQRGYYRAELTTRIKGI